MVGAERVLSPAVDHDNYMLPASKNIERIDLFGNPLPAGSPLRATLVYLTATTLSDLQAALK